MMKARLILAIAASLLLSNVVQAAEIRLLASSALKESYFELFPEFEKTTGHKIMAAWSGTPDIQKRVLAGEAVDLVISAGGTDEFFKQGKLVPGSEAKFGKSSIGVAVRPGAPKPDISSADALKKAVLAAKSVAYSAGASGAYVASMFEKLGISDQVKAKTVTVKPGEPVGEVVARGDAEIGFQQVGELLSVKGTQYVGPLPPELQKTIVFSGGIHSGTKVADAAAALIKFLTSPAAAEVLRKHGLEPA
jgi:molybdate transport system substrate-binding protein